MKSLLIILVLVGFGKAQGQSDQDEPITPLPLDYSFVSKGGNVTKLLGEEVKFRCEVAGLGPMQFVSWLNGTSLLFFGRTTVTMDSRIKLLDETGAEGPSESDVYELVISDPTVQDEGTYTCSVSGAHPITQDYILTVNIMPLIRMEPAERSMDVMLGDPVDVACMVLEGKPEVTVTWSRQDDAPVFENDEVHHVGQELSFTAAEKRHIGTYLCAAENDAGTITEKIKINVLYAPNVTVEDRVVHTGPDKEEKITCNFDANPEVNVSWKHNDIDINFDERSHIEYEQKNGRASLIIRGVKEEDFGVYLCKGGNGKGRDAEAVIKLSALPYELRFLSEELSHYSDAYTLEWQVGSVPPLIECNLRMEEVNSTGEYFLGNNTIPAQLDAMIHEYQIRDLHANGTYRLELDCRNAFGSTPTEVLVFRTSEQDRPAPPPSTTTTPKTVKDIEDETDAMSEMNTLDMSSKVVVTEESFTNYVEKTETENPNGGASHVAMNLILVIVTSILVTW